MTDPIGAMRARVGLQRPERVEDDLGGAEIVWINEGEVWAAIEAVSVGERAGYDAAPSMAAFRVVINRRDDVRAGWRLLWGERLLRVVGARDDGAARVALHCEEETL